MVSNYSNTKNKDKDIFGPSDIPMTVLRLERAGIEVRLRHGRLGIRGHQARHNVTKENIRAWAREYRDDVNGFLTLLESVRQPEDITDQPEFSSVIFDVLRWILRSDIPDIPATFSPDDLYAPDASTWVWVEHQMKRLAYVRENLITCPHARQTWRFLILSRRERYPDYQRFRAVRDANAWLRRTVDLCIAYEIKAIREGWDSRVAA